jgi:HlyD family secretion protein
MSAFLKRTWIWWLVLALAAAGAVLWFGQRARQVDIVTVERGPIVQSVVATGRVATPAQVAISSQATARIESILVREGDRVRAGQLLAQLRSDEALAALESARAALLEAQGRQRQLETVQRPVAQQQLAQAQSSADALERERVRLLDLVGRGYISQSRADDAQRLADSARAALESARAQARALAPDGIETELARVRMSQARANLASATARLDTLRLTAPADGVVLTRSAETGDTAQAGRVLLVLAQSGSTRIIAPVDEKNLRWLSVGQQATALADAFPGEAFPARLSWIAPSVDLQRGTVEVWLEVAKPPAWLRPDMTVSVEMVVARRDSALRLPAWLLREADVASPANASVMVVSNGRARRQPVSLGMRGIGVVEVREGLSEGDSVITPESGAIDGERVRIRSTRSNVNLGGLPAGR